MSRLAEMLRESPYQGYTYAYPHKMAYRPLPQPVPLRELWAEERQDALFLYLHLPFCAARCGFCNLFSLANPESRLVERYLTALERQARQVRKALPDARFSRLAIGGGTPSLLAPAELERLFIICTEIMGADPRHIPVSVEASPATLTAEKLAVLRGQGVDRLSLGIQSFDDEENRRLGRRQSREAAHRALAMIREAGFPVLNVDLIYGGDGQTAESWRASLEEALRYAPEELYLYPLYVRPLTGLAGYLPTEDHRLQRYREARDLLLDHGYRQVSQRMFRARSAPAEDGPAYCCQRDGMVGLGRGARSYTRHLHYAAEFAVSRGRVREILDEYLQRSDAEFAVADYGFALDEDERRRRFLLKSILLCDGLERAAFRKEFDIDAPQAFPELRELEERGLAEFTPACLRLTAAGIECSDTIGPWLYSEKVRAVMDAWMNG